MSPMVMNRKYKPFEESSRFEGGHHTCATEEKSLHNFSRFNEISLNEPVSNGNNTFKK
jgi:hypothetical protein